jgi:hypothetical protein
MREIAELEAGGYRAFMLGEPGEVLADQVLVGPGGVFLVRVNRWPGRFSFRRDGWFRHSRKDAGELVGQVSRDAAALKARLGENGTAPSVEGIVAVARSKMKAPVIHMGRVTFVAAPSLGSYLRSRRPALSAEQVEQVAAGMAA